MKYKINKKMVTTSVLLTTVFSMSITNFIHSYPKINTSIQKDLSTNVNLSTLVSNTEKNINDNVYGKNGYIETYGFLQNVLAKNEENNFEVVKDKDGVLHFAYFSGGPNPTDELVKRVGRLKTYLGTDTKVSVLLPPDKYVKGITNWEEGMPYTYVNETADNYINGINDLGIHTLDFRPMVANSGLSEEKLFFKTDHHWKIETSFMAFKYLLGDIKKTYNLDLDPNGYYTNLANYNQLTYEQAVIGSQSRKTGVVYGGLDDFTLIYPKFQTSFSLYVTMQGEYDFSKDGSFEEALIDKDSLYKENTFDGDGDKYSAYLFGNKSLVKIKNKMNTTGPKIALIKDSYSVPLAAFLSNVCSEVDLIDPRYYKGDIAQYVKENKFDYTFVSIIPSSLTDEFFPYCKGEY